MGCTLIKLVNIGIIGSVAAALCCFSPALVMLFGVLGVRAMTCYLDLLLLPTLAGFIVIIGYALCTH